jgi:hypothetical protein
MDEKERVTAVIAVKSLAEDYLLVMGTRKGQIKKTRLAEFQHMAKRPKGLIAMNLNLKQDELVSARLARGDSDLIFVTEQGQSIRFPASEVTAHSRAAGGVRGMRIATNERVIAMDVVMPDSHLLTVSRNGYGKLTALNLYRRQGRGGHGVRTFKVTQKTGPVVASTVVQRDQEIMLVSTKGIVIRTTLEEIRITGRIAQGVRIMNLEPDDTVASLACLPGKPGNGPEGEEKPGRGPRAALGVKAKETDKGAKEKAPARTKGRAKARVKRLSRAPATRKPAHTKARAPAKKKRALVNKKSRLTRKAQRGRPQARASPAKALKPSRPRPSKTKRGRWGGR